MISTAISPLIPSPSKYASPFPTPRLSTGFSNSFPASTSTASSANRILTFNLAWDSRFPSESAPSSKQNFVGLLSLPTELILQIVDLLYLPPTSFATAHQRNVDLRSLGLAGGKRIQDVVRSILFSNIILGSMDEGRWLIGRMDKVGAFIRHLTITTSTLTPHISYVISRTPNLVSLCLRCKLLVKPTSAQILPILPLLPDLRSLQFNFVQGFSPDFLTELSSWVNKITGRGLSELEITSKFLEGGVMKDCVDWQQDDLDIALRAISTFPSTLTHLVLPLQPSKISFVQRHHSLLNPNLPSSATATATPTPASVVDNTTLLPTAEELPKTASLVDSLRNARPSLRTIRFGSGRGPEYFKH
ncbi:hypothetical protein [Phaffia rhodozyma]|uniref:Uncharacterized protein n=1 Tax=Phaffia rhodozyma TaxID=264483 RepID=A0A0F7SPC2_PHARH|nr:hypothetical protein [Phaffia rhodozyma]